MREIDTLTEALELTGGDRHVLAQQGVAHLMANGNRIISMRDIEGLHVDAREEPDGISARITVRANTQIEHPVHLCFGIAEAEGTQRIAMNVVIEEGARAHFIAHCLFPNAERVRHVMEGAVEVRERAEMRYSEVHYHGPFGGIDVLPSVTVTVRRNGRYLSDFSLTWGRVGNLGISYAVEAQEGAVTELIARVFGHGDDTVKIWEKVLLSGEGSRGLIKTRVALEDRATAEVTGITEGNAPGARGHVDCLEIVKDQAHATAIPIVNVNNPLAKITHEAAIGSVDRKQLETIMAHGLSPEEAVDVIVKGILR